MRASAFVEVAFSPDWSKNGRPGSGISDFAHVSAPAVLRAPSSDSKTTRKWTSPAMLPYTRGDLYKRAGGL